MSLFEVAQQRQLEKIYILTPRFQNSYTIQCKLVLSDIHIYTESSCMMCGLFFSGFAGMCISYFPYFFPEMLNFQFQILIQILSHIGDSPKSSPEQALNSTHRGHPVQQCNNSGIVFFPRIHSWVYHESKVRNWLWKTVRKSGSSPPGAKQISSKTNAHLNPIHYFTPFTLASTSASLLHSPIDCLPIRFPKNGLPLHHKALVI